VCAAVEHFEAWIELISTRFNVKTLSCIFIAVVMAGSAMAQSALLGKSEAEMVALKGKPISKIVAGSTSIYHWADVEVTLERGIVTYVAAKESEPTPAKEEILFKIKRPYGFGAGGIAEYHLLRIEATDTIWLYIFGEKKGANNRSIDMCVIFMKTGEVGKFMAALEQIKLYSNTAEQMPKVVGQFSGNTLYYKPPCFLTFGSGSTGNSTLTMIEGGSGEGFVDPPFLTTRDIDIVYAIFDGWKKGGDYSALEIK